MQKNEVKVTWLRMTQSGKAKVAEIAKEHGDEKLIPKIYEGEFYERVYEVKNERGWQFVFVETSRNDFKHFSFNPTGILFKNVDEFLEDVVENDGGFEIIGHSVGYQSETSDGDLLVDFGKLELVEGINDAELPLEREFPPFVMN